MKLIKIFSDRLQIKSDTKDLSGIKINDLLTVEDSAVTLVCAVSSITGSDTMDIYNYDSETMGQIQESNTIECGILGSLQGGKFTKSVDLYPTTNVKISVVTDVDFSKMLGAENKSGFKFGEYANYSSTAFVDGNKLFQRHFAIVGNTGSGKSFTVASLMEKASELKGSNVVLFDLHGEYSGLDYAKTIKIGNDGLSFPLWFLPFKDFYGSLLKVKDETSPTLVAALRRAFYESRKSEKPEDVPIAFSVSDISETLSAENSQYERTGEFYKSGDKAGQEKLVKGELNGKLYSLIALLGDKLIDKRFAFMTRHESQRYIYDFLHELFDTGDKNIKVVDLSEVPDEIVPTIIAVTAKLLYSVQTQQDRENIAPITIICDEAHAYIPSSDFALGASQRRLLEIFETIAKEGRKFGTTLGIVSQRPSELNKTIMAQCANFIVMKMSNETDKSMVKGILPESSRGLVDSLSLFSPGDCIVIGDCASISFKLKIDVPKCKPLSNTIDVWDIWSSSLGAKPNELVDKLFLG